MKQKKNISMHGMLLLLLLAVTGCGQQVQEVKEASGTAVEGADDNKIVIYTSMYQEIVDEIDKQLEIEFPQYDIEFVCEGTGILQSRIMDQIEYLSLECDMLMVAEPSYSLELKEMDLLHSYQAKTEDGFSLKHDPDGSWYPVRICNMVLAYNPDFNTKEEVAQSFYDFASNADIKDGISMPNPRTSGTTMASVSALYNQYGADYFRKLGDQNVVVEDSSDALKKLEAGQYKEIMILEESVLKARQENGSKIEVIYPDDGVINIPSTIMIVREDWSANRNIEICEEISNWFVSKEGQQNIINGWMHSVRENPESYPYDSKPTSEIMENAISIDWEKCYREKRGLKSIFRQYVILKNKDENNIDKEILLSN